jgi:hypothetical protein
VSDGKQSSENDDDDKVIPPLPDVSQDLETLLGSGAPVESDDPE